MDVDKNLNCRQAFTSVLLKKAEENKNIFAVSSDSRGSVTLGEFAKKLPLQFVEVGIAEQNAVGISAGLALSGKKTFLCGPACFYSARAVEQIKNDVTYADADVKIVGVSGGVSYGGLGSTHHSLHDIALFRALPNITILLPSDYEETVRMTEYLVASDGPVYMRLGRGAVPAVYSEDSCPFHPGKANMIFNSGDDCLIIATGEAVYHSLEAAKLLHEKEKIGVKVLDIHTVKPLDRDGILSAASKVRAVVTVEEHSIYGGLGGCVAELLGQELPKPMKIIGFPDEFMPSGSSSELFHYAGVTKENIASKALGLLKGLN